MPVPKPHKGEKQDDFMKRCMHEVSSNSDRTNDQNVAICKDAWRKGPQKEETNSSNSAVYPSAFCKMNTFKTLAEARGAYDTLAAQLAEMQVKTASFAELETQLAESKAFGTVTATENENFRLLIVQKDEEISGLKGEKEDLNGLISDLRSHVEILEKNQKSAKIHARELVAASGGAPIAVDQAEINRMQAGDEKEFVAEMKKEMDPKRLNELYKEYNRLFRPNGKRKK